MQKSIVWEKWIDPFGDDTIEAKWTDYDNDIDMLSIENNEEILPSDLKFPEKPIKVIASPLGLIPYNEYTASSKIFNFWIGHTNFNITENVKKIIEDTEGVEILDIFTRYRFRIAIAKCFDDASVMAGIQHNIDQLL